MAGVRKKANKRGGNYQGYFVNHLGKREFFTGTNSRQETREMAQHLEAEHKQMRLGLKPLPTSPLRYRGRPFLEVVEEHIAWGRAFGRRDGKPWTEETAGRKASYLQKWGETLNLKNLADVDDILPRVETVLRGMAEQGMTGTTLACYINPLTSFLNWCVGRKYLAKDPLENLSTIDKTPETERRALTVNELNRLFSVAPLWRRLVYAVALCTGFRRSELRRLDLGDLDVENDRLCVRWKLTKNKKPAVQYLPSKLVQQLVAFAEPGNPARFYRKAKAQYALPESPLLFVPSHIPRILNRDLERVGIAKDTREGHFDFHALRACFTTRAMEAGANLKELQTMARHSDPKLTMNIYAKKRDGRLAELAEKIGESVAFGGECATSVQEQPEVPQPESCKLLPRQALSLTENEKGPYHADTGLPISEPEHNVDTILSETAENSGKTYFQTIGGTQSVDTSRQRVDASERLKCATRVLQECNDPRLARLVERWPCLSADVQVEIMRLVR